MKLRLTFLIFTVLGLFSMNSDEKAVRYAQKSIETDVLVIGGGTGGVAAAIQSARMGAKTILVVDGPWLGGMLSAAGVSATDGNHELHSGIWREFVQALIKHYGSEKKLATGWVSNTQFEPHVADSIFKRMVFAEKKLEIVYNTQFLRVLKQENRVLGALFDNGLSNALIEIRASQTIDATELGDVLADAGAAFDLGMEAESVTGERVGVTATNDIIQDLTYVAILKDYGKGRDCTITKPAGYDPREFDGACSNYYYDTLRRKPTVDAQKMLNYGKLPGGKYLINWPIYGNDTYLNVVNMRRPQRDSALVAARQTTLRFIYFIQTQLGFPQLGLADDEFPTADRLALIPYHREGRRVKGLMRFNMNQLASPFQYNLYKTGISVGDYPIDHHHKKNPAAPQHLEFYPVPSYNIPLGTLIPETTDGLIIAEKGISVTNVVNGTTRLQPVVMLTGQAAGALAALSSIKKMSARMISIREVQAQLLRSGAYLMPYNDVKPDHPNFASIQKIGATGLLRGQPTPHGWANQTWFYPDSAVYTKDLAPLADFFGKLLPTLDQRPLSYESARMILRHYGGRSTESTRVTKSGWISRAVFATWLDESLDPFSRPVNHSGDFIQKGRDKNRSAAR